VHPVLIEIGRFNVYAFGFMLALSFLAGIYLSTYRAKRFGVDPQLVLDLSVYLIVAGVVGSRLLYVVYHLGAYNNFVDFFALWQGGATLYGGLILATVVAYFFCRRKNVDWLLMGDIFAPALALGFMVTRVGCYLSGCCYGKPTTLSWGVVFPPESAAGSFANSFAEHAGEIIRLHPSQLYASFYGLVIFMTIMLFQNKLTKRGAQFGVFLAMYGLFRFTNDFTRYYESNMRMLLDLTLNQWISVGLMILGSFLILRKTNARTRAVPASS